MPATGSPSGAHVEHRHGEHRVRRRLVEVTDPLPLDASPADAGKEIPSDPAAIHRLYLATNDLHFSNDSTSGDSSRAGAGGSPMRRSGAFALSGSQGEGSTFRETARATFARPLPALRPVEEAPPMSLETLVQMPRWQASRRGQNVAGSEIAHAAAAAQLSSTSSLPSMPTTRDMGGPASGNHSTSTPTLPRPGMAMNASTRSRKSHKPEHDRTLGSAARELIEARRVARERRYRMTSTFTDGRRRAALMRCMESIEQNGSEPTLGEISKQLMQGGWQDDEVQDHLLLAANDPGRFKITSSREHNEGKPAARDSRLPDIAEACNGTLTEHAQNALQLRSTIDGFRDLKSKSKGRMRAVR